MKQRGVKGSATLLLSMLVFVCSASGASLVGPYVAVDVVVGTQAGHWELPLSDAGITYDAGLEQWYWEGDGIDVLDGSNVVATIDDLNLRITGDIAWAPQYILNYTMHGATEDTQVTIAAATLDLAHTLTGAGGILSAGGTVTSVGGDPASMTTLAGFEDKFAVAYYSGGSVFKRALGDDELIGITGSHSDSENAFGGIAAPVTDMQLQYAFQITAGDQSSGSATYGLTPEPAGLALLALGAVVLLRRRR